MRFYAFYLFVSCVVSTWLQCCNSIIHPSDCLFKEWLIHDALLHWVYDRGSCSMFELMKFTTRSMCKHAREWRGRNECVFPWWGGGRGVNIYPEPPRQPCIGYHLCLGCLIYFTVTVMKMFGSYANIYTTCVHLAPWKRTLSYLFWVLYLYVSVPLLSQGLFRDLRRHFGVLIALRLGMERLSPVAQLPCGKASTLPRDPPSIIDRK